MIVQKWACLPWRPPWIDLHQIWQNGSPRRPDQPWQFFFGNRPRGFDSVRSRILPFSYLQVVAINTVLALPRSLWCGKLWGSTSCKVWYSTSSQPDKKLCVYVCAHMQACKWWNILMRNWCILWNDYISVTCNFHVERWEQKLMSVQHETRVTDISLLCICRQFHGVWHWSL